MTKEISDTYRTLVDTPIDQAAEEERNRHIAKLFDGLLPRAEVERIKLLAENSALRARCEAQEKVIEMARKALQAIYRGTPVGDYSDETSSQIAAKALAAMKEKP